MFALFWQNPTSPLAILLHWQWFREFEKQTSIRSWKFGVTGSHWKSLEVMGSSSSKFKKYLQHGDEYAAMQVSNSNLISFTIDSRWGNALSKISYFTCFVILFTADWTCNLKCRLYNFLFISHFIKFVILLN
jgi:hypothetical protein